LREYQMYIDGRFIDNGSRKMMNVINPSTEEVVSRFPAGTAEDVDMAVKVAAAAQKDWARLAPVTRAGYLKEIAALVRDNAEMLADTIAEEQGKTGALGEVIGMAENIEYVAEFARRYTGEIVPSDDTNENILTYKMPIGVAAGILPWNFPFYVLSRKLAPALLTGCTIVIKPSSQTPNNAFEFAKLIDKSSLPKGVFNLVSGPGGVIGNALAGHPQVGIVSVTGSVGAGIKIMEAASKNITKVSLELGGKAPAIVMADADLDKAAAAIAASRMKNNGQVCNCIERVYVQESVADKFIEKIKALMSRYVCGDPRFEPDVNIGPLVSAAHLKEVDGMVKKAIADGAECILGGGRDLRHEKGYFYQPTIFVGCRHKDAIMRDEIFGPVLPISTFKTLDEAIEKANDSEYGLTSAVFTKDLDTMMRAANEIRFGETYINTAHGEAYQGFHAGLRKSGIGGADGLHGVEEYLVSHTVYISYDTNKQ